MTFSLAGRCVRTGMVGVVVASSSPAVGARCAHVRAGVGAVLTQNVTDPRLGPRVLDVIESGVRAPDALRRVMSDAAHAEHRQLVAIDCSGATAVFSGRNTLGIHATAIGTDCVAAGNLLAGAIVPDSMVEAFVRSTDLHLGDRLVGALQAGLQAGGEAGPVRSASMMVAREVPWPVVDLRVDWADAPVAELDSLWQLWAPQLDAYVRRALDPDRAPAFGAEGE